jgi:hypothetical protein
MITRIRDSKLTKVLCLFLVFNFWIEFLSPLRLMALTGGPAQPELTGFTPVDSGNLVDIFSGDFHYTLPVMSVPGPNGSYPINLNYASSVGMEHEASWVGLGWNLNPGAVNRQVRGIPDDFKGEAITKDIRRRSNNTYVFTSGGGGEVAGGDFGIGAGAKEAIVYNTYSGLSLSKYFGLSSSYVKDRKSGDKNLMPTASIGAGLNFDSDNGITTSFSLGQSAGAFSWGQHFGYNSKSGNYTFSQQAGVSFPASDSKPSEKSSVRRSISFSTASSVPGISIPYEISTFSGDFQVGAELAVVEGYGTVGSKVCVQKTPDRTLSYPAYGLLHSDAAGNGSLQDYNLEKDIPMNKHTLNLPLPVMTHDIYSIAGELQGGSFRAYRSDYGHFFENRVTVQSSALELGGDIGIGAAQWQFGGTLHANSTSTSSGDWSGDAYNAKLQFRGKDRYAASKDYISPVVYEPFYFKMSGEMTASATSALSDIGHEEAVRFEVSKNQADAFLGIKTNNYTINNMLRDRSGNRPLMRNFTQNERAKRSNSIEYKLRGNDDGVRKKNHIAEFSIVDADGNRFTYGDPLYNIVEKEVSFSLNYQEFSNNIAKTSIAVYNTDYAKLETAMNRRAGKERLLSRTVTPGYAYSYPLRQVTSADYVDVDRNGPSDNDFGYWVKFHYTKTHGESNPYKWRFPYLGASFMMGAPSNKNDDQGSYAYGEKETAYLDSIVTKTHVAVFYISNRADGRDVAGELAGGLGSNRLCKLDSIALFSRNDRSVPIKTAVFGYDYSLCQGVPNNGNGVGNNGKLTLKTVYFKYGPSGKGEGDPYVFTYGDGTNNFGYDPSKMDRWGNYQATANHFDHYVPQGDRATQDRWAGAWLLSKIKLPSKGEMEVEYESDAYAYVQDKQAMCMAEIDYARSSLEKSGGKYYVYFKTRPDDRQIDPNEYIASLSDNLLFVKYALYPATAGGVPDYIQGYIEFVPNSAVAIANASGAPVTVRVEVKPFELYDMHPIRFLALRYLRTDRPDLLFNNYDREDGNGDVKGFFRALVSGGFIAQLKAMRGEKAFYKHCDNRTDFYKTFSPPVSGMKSWVRVNVAGKSKLGGGARVRSVTLHDDWSKGSPSFYKQEYYYTKMENGRLISSGVAEYEPMVCAEENGMRYPVYDKSKGLFYKEHELYAEKPYGESYFPAANVGYSQVTVKNHTPGNVNLAASGIQAHRFHTAKDFPVVVEQTNPYIDYDNKPNLISLLTIGTKQTAASAYSQGYKIELNDMHGKLKSVATYPYQATENEKKLAELVESSGYASSVEYIYKTRANNPKRIDNTVSVLVDDNNPVIMKLGETHDFVVHMGETQSLSEGGGMSVNVIASVTPPYILPPSFPTIDSFEEVARYITTAKVIYKSGILEKTVAVNNGSRIVTRNHHWDPYTGEVLMSSATNEFDKPVYGYSMPAYWFHDRMGSAARNYRASYKSSWPDVTDLSCFIPYDRFGDSTYTAKQVSKSNSNLRVQYWRNDQNPTQQDFSSYEILRSGRSNQLSASAASLTSLTDPIAERRMPFFDAFNSKDSTCFRYKKCDGSVWTGKILARGDSLVFASFSGDNRDFCFSGFPLQGPNIEHVAIKGVPTWNFPPLLSLRFEKRGSRLYVLYRNSRILYASYPWNDPDNYFPECQDGVLQAGAVEYGADWVYSYADAGSSDISTNRQHYLGIPNIHKPLRSNLFVEQRRHTGTAPGYKTNIAYDGTYNYFSYFNRETGNAGNMQEPWSWSAEITKYSPFNFEIENKNALGIYSAALYGYGNSLATAVVNNSRYCETAFCHFEDMSSPSSPHGHLQLSRGSVYTGDGHSGNKSWRCAVLDARVNSGENLAEASYDGTATLKKGEKYVFSCWAKKPVNSTGVYTEAGYHYTVSVGGAVLPLVPEAPVEGWQRIEFEFTAPASGDNFNIIIHAGGSAIFFDDIRIHPYNAVMKSYVYDPANYRLAAELDENNYATFYNYDEEGALAQVKKETERGVMTIQTTRQNLKKSARDTGLNP